MYNYVEEEYANFRQPMMPPLKVTNYYSMDNDYDIQQCTKEFWKLSMLKQRVRLQLLCKDCQKHGFHERDKFEVRSGRLYETSSLCPKCVHGNIELANVYKRYFV